MEHVPSPADAFTAEEFLADVAARGGRIFRMLEPPKVFVLTTDEHLAADLQRRGGRPHLPPHLPADDLRPPRNSYERVKGGTEEWDIWISGIPLLAGDRTMWDVAGDYRP